MALRDNGEFISGMGTDFRDMDNDGYPDIVVAALDDETFPIFRNGRTGEFTDDTMVSKMAGLSMRMAGYSPMIFDFDNDGWKDIFLRRAGTYNRLWRRRAHGGSAQHGVPQSWFSPAICRL